MKIARRLQLLVLTALASMVFLVAVNLYESDQVYTSANYANVNTVPSVVQIDKAAVALGLMRVRLYRHALVSGLSEKLELEKKIAAARGELLAALKKYEAEDITDAEDGRYLSQENEILATYFPVMDTLLETSRRGDRDGAATILISLASTAQHLTDVMDAHAAYNVKLGQGAAAKAVAAKQSAMLIGAGALLIAGIFMAWQGLIVIGAVRRQLLIANEVAERIADGDLRRDERLGQAGPDEIGDLLRMFERMREKLADTMGSIVRGTDSVLRSATVLQTATRQTSQATERQAQASSESAAAIEELTVSIDQVGVSAVEANGRADDSRALASKSADSVRAAAQQVSEVAQRVEQTSTQVGALSDDVREIGKITVVIREVAEQTNLLALNAAIEAARAGEQGRGFAVVADEVRKLAERTTRSVQEISTVIHRIQDGAEVVVASMATSRDMVANVVTTAQESGSAMHGIIQSVDTVHGAITQISSALQEQRGASGELARNVESIAQMSEENSASVGTMSHTAEELRSIADSLNASTARFRM